MIDRSSWPSITRRMLGTKLTATLLPHNDRTKRNHRPPAGRRARGRRCAPAASGDLRSAPTTYREPALNTTQRQAPPQDPQPSRHITRNPTHRSRDDIDLPAGHRPHRDHRRHPIPTPTHHLSHRGPHSLTDRPLADQAGGRWRASPPTNPTAVAAVVASWPVWRQGSGRHLGDCSCSINQERSDPRPIDSWRVLSPTARGDCPAPQTRSDQRPGST